MTYPTLSYVWCQRAGHNKSNPQACITPIILTEHLRLRCAHAIPLLASSFRAWSPLPPTVGLRKRGYVMDREAATRFWAITTASALIPDGTGRLCMALDWTIQAPSAVRILNRLDATGGPSSGVFHLETPQKRSSCCDYPRSWHTCAAVSQPATPLARMRETTRTPGIGQSLSTTTANLRPAAALISSCEAFESLG